MIRTYSIPGIVTARIEATSSRTQCSARCELGGKVYESPTRPADCKEQAIEDVRDQLDKLFAHFGRASTLLAVALLLLAGNASAETLHKGKVHETTSDRIIAERQLVCSYAKPRFEALPDGRTVVINGKVCIEVSR